MSWNTRFWLKNCGRGFCSKNIHVWERHGLFPLWGTNGFNLIYLWYLINCITSRCLINALRILTLSLLGIPCLAKERKLMKTLRIFTFLHVQYQQLCKNESKRISYTTFDSITGSLIQLKTLQDIYFLNADYHGHTFITDSDDLSEGLGSRIGLNDQCRGLVKAYGCQNPSQRYDSLIVVKRILALTFLKV